MTETYSKSRQTAETAFGNHSVRSSSPAITAVAEIDFVENCPKDQDRTAPGSKVRS